MMKSPQFRTFEEEKRLDKILDKGLNCEEACARTSRINLTPISECAYLVVRNKIINQINQTMSRLDDFNTHLTYIN